MAVWIKMYNLTANIDQLIQLILRFTMVNKHENSCDKLQNNRLHAIDHHQIKIVLYSWQLVRGNMQCHNDFIHFLYFY